MTWSWRLIAASWSASWLAASLAVAPAVARAQAPAQGSSARVCDPESDAATYYPVVFGGSVESITDQRDSTRRPGVPAWVPSWVPFASEAGTVAVPHVRFQVSVRYRGEVHGHESVRWLAGRPPQPGARYTVFATVDRDSLATYPCAPNRQGSFDAARYELEAKPPLPDPDPSAGWQLGGVAVAAVLVLSAAAAALVLGRRRRQPG
jgi:hypothetical protein